MKKIVAITIVILAALIQFGTSTVLPESSRHTNINAEKMLADIQKF